MSQEPSDTDLTLATSLGQIPSVTAILAAVGLGPNYNGVSPAVLERKRLLGSALHWAVHYDALSVLDETSVHPDIQPSLALWRAWLAESGFRVLQTELEIIHPRWLFLGHPDAICLMPKGGHAILDLKLVASVDKSAVALQLAGYRILVQDVLKLPVSTCAALQIDGGRYRYLDLTTQAIAESQTFLAALIVFKARQRRR